MIVFLGGFTGVHIHCHQCLGLVDDQFTARRQLNVSVVQLIDGRFDTKVFEYRLLPLIQVEHFGQVGHALVKVRFGIFKLVLIIDHDLFDIRRQIIADGSNHQLGLAVQQGGGSAQLCTIVDSVPGFGQRLEVAEQILTRTIHSSCTNDDCHSRRDVQGGQKRAGPFSCTVVINLPRDSASRVIRMH